MQESIILKEMMKTERVQEHIDKADEKGLNTKLLKDLCYPENRKRWVTLILQGKYHIFPSHAALIPKDEKGKFRTVYICEDLDRIFLSLANDVFCELFKSMIHKNCVSYQRGSSTQKVVKQVSNEIVRLGKIKNHIGYKTDFEKYFDFLKIEKIDSIFDEMEKRVGLEKGTDPVINVIREYYHLNLYFDEYGNVCEKYCGIKQGSATSSFLSNAALYELDEFMSNKYSIYTRYCDDCICIDENTDEIINDMNRIIAPYGIRLNPKKVEPLYSDRWFKFLGFNIKRSMITLSKTRVKKFQREIEKRTIDIKKKRKNYTSKQARKSVIRFLYEGEFSWATSCLGVINVESDIQELNKFIMDCIRACDTGKLKVGGLGSVNYLDDRTILRGRGRNVKANRKKTDKIENYLSVKCLSNDLKICKEVFDAAVRNMKG